MVSRLKAGEKVFWSSELASPQAGDQNLVSILSFKGVSSEEPIEVWGSGYRFLYLSEYENAQLRTENYILREKIRAIEERLASIEDSIPKERIVVLREITGDEAKAEIARLFSEGKTLYYSDIARELQLDLELVVDICNELMNEGEISVADSA